MSDQPASTTSAPRPVPASDLARVAHGAHPLPHDLLGPHRHDGGVTVRTLRPMAESVYAVLGDGSRTELKHEHAGVWVGVLAVEDVPDYRLEVTYPGHDAITVDEPYRFLPTVGEMDRHLISEGRHEQLWEVMGAHVRRYPGQMGDVTGTSFAVWAPHAQAVRVVGDFNHWDGRGHALRSLGGSGVWELFVPGVGEGTHYKFELLGRDGHWRQKADPMAYGTEVPPSTASKVVESTYEWQDDEWLAARAASDPHTAPMSAYEVHLGSWREGLSYRELGEQLVEHVQQCGFTHVELMPVAEHPYGGSWGYQITSYYAPTARFGHPDDFRYLVDKLHQAGIGVILDWVPAHFPRDAWALARFDGEPLYEYPDPRKGEHPDWGTLVFDYGRPEVRNFLVANALYWMEEFHIDGIRVDAVASMLYLDYSREDGQWVANKFGGREHLEAIDFLQEFNATAYKRVPGIVTIAEESTAWPGVTRETHLGGLGFGLKWNMGWMHDSLGYMAEDPVHRQYHHHRLTFSMMYAFSEQFVLPISHDEVVHGKGSLLRKMPGDRWKQLANIRAFLAFMWAHPGKQLLFMGSEFAQESEWAESRSLDWWLLDQPAHRGVQDLVSELNSRYKQTPALHELDSDPNGFEWIDANDAQHNVFSFIRRDRAGNPLVCIVNFAGSPHEGYRIGLPHSGTWNEVLNTDAPEYGGSGVGNLGRVEAEDTPCHGLPASVTLRIPPLGAVWLEPAGERKQYVPPPPPAREEAAPAEVASADASPADASPAAGAATDTRATDTAATDPAATETAAATATRKTATKKAATKKTATKSAATKTAATKAAATKTAATKNAATKKAPRKRAATKGTTTNATTPEPAGSETPAPIWETPASPRTPETPESATTPETPTAAKKAAAKKTAKTAATKKTAKPAAAAPLSGPEVPPSPPAPEVAPDPDTGGAEQP